MIETELIEVLVNDADVSVLVGDRVALSVIPEGSPAPYIVCQLITGQRPGSLSSTGNRRRLRMQVNCYAQNVLQAKAIVEAAQNAIENYENFEVVFNGDQDLYDATTKLCYTVLDYSLTQNPD